MIPESSSVWSASNAKNRITDGNTWRSSDGHMVQGVKNPLFWGYKSRLTQLLDEGVFSQKEVASAAGIGRNTLSVHERNESTPRVSSLLSLANALGVSPTWLAYGTQGGLPFRQRRPVVPFDPPMPALAARPASTACADLAQRLTTARTQQGLSLRKLGAAAGMSAQAVLLIERGDSNPLISTVEALAVALDCAPGWLAFGEGEGPQ